MLSFPAVLKRCIPAEGWSDSSETVACPSVFPNTHLKTAHGCFVECILWASRHSGSLLCFQDQFHENNFSRWWLERTMQICVLRVLVQWSKQDSVGGYRPQQQPTRMSEPLGFFSSAFSLAYLRAGLQHCWRDRSAVSFQWQQHLCQPDQKGWGSLPWWPVTRRR